MVQEVMHEVVQVVMQQVVLEVLYAVMQELLFAGVCLVQGMTHGGDQHSGATGRPSVLACDVPYCGPNSSPNSPTVVPRGLVVQKTCRCWVVMVLKLRSCPEVWWCRTVRGAAWGLCTTVLKRSL